MKKIILLAAAAFSALFFLSCQKESAPVDASALKFNFTVSDPPGGTRAIKQGWENGDVINIWFDTNISKEPDMYLVYQDGSWFTSEVKAEIAQNLKEEGNLKFFWEGSNSWDTWVLAYPTISDHWFKPAEGNGHPLLLNQSGSHSKDAYHFDKSTNTITATLHWSYRTNIQVVVEGITPADGYKMKCQNGSGIHCPFGISINSDNTSMPNGSVPVLGVANEENTTAFSLQVIDPGEHDITFVLIAPDNKEIYYSVKKTFDFPAGQNGEHFYAARLLKYDFYTDVIDGHAAVNMGEGYYWATKNVGARNAGAVGDGFAWGETEPYYESTDPIVWKEGKQYGYDLTSYEKFGTGSGFQYDKYNATDGLTVLQPVDDAATANWGGSWRMPTQAEQQWLIDNCDWEVISISGYEGRKITSKITGNSIFLPSSELLAAQHVPDQSTGTGNYWSSSSAMNGGMASRLVFDGSSQVVPAAGYVAPRYFGTAIRAVTVKND